MLQDFLKALLDLAPAGIVAALAVLTVFGVQRLSWKHAEVLGVRTRWQLLIFGLSAAWGLAVIFALPLEAQSRGQLLSFLGILLSAAIALSSTTLLGNALAGLMLRAVGSFRVGDFVLVEEHFGRVSERGLFHTEIQTEDRDLTTLPNLYFATHPVKVVRASGTIVSATVSLGYDVPRSRIKDGLIAAAEAVGLEEPFVQVTDLGDFSVTYRTAGLLKKVRELISTRSRLRAAVLDALHERGIEIVSPTFMNTRAHAPDRHFIPRATFERADEDDEGDGPESVVFDKAEEAASLESLRERFRLLTEREAGLEKALKEAVKDEETAPERKEALERELARASQRRERLRLRIEERTGEA